MTAQWGVADVQDPGVPEEGHEVNMSVSRNADCTYDVVSRDRAPEQGDAATWTHGSVSQSVSSTAYSGQAAIPSVPSASAGQTVSARFSRNSDCTYSGQVDVVSSTPDSGTSWNGGTACQPVTYTLYDHVTAIPSTTPGSMQSIDASFSRESDGTYSGRVAVRDYSGMSGEVYRDSWESVEESPNHRYVYETTIIMFRHMRSIPTIPKSARISVDVHMEDDCTFSGTITATKLKKWEVYGSGGSGGLATGSYDREEYAVIGGVVCKRTLKYNTTVYQGSGNASASTLSGFDSVVGYGYGVMGIKCTNPGVPWEPA